MIKIINLNKGHIEKIKAGTYTYLEINSEYEAYFYPLNIDNVQEFTKSLYARMIAGEKFTENSKQKIKLLVKEFIE